jgi:hypothetical protein
VSRYNADYVLHNYHFIVILLTALERSALSRCRFLSRKQELNAKTVTSLCTLLTVLVQVQLLNTWQDLNKEYNPFSYFFLSSILILESG